MSGQDKIKNLRIKKLKELIQRGLNVYPSRCFKDTEIAASQRNFASWSESKKEIVLAGRIMSLRIQGGIIFIDLRDFTGTLQLVFKKDLIDDFELIKDYLDIGDFMEAKGYFFKTQRGENSLLVKNWKILAKTLRALPSKWFGLKDVEERFRRRYLDLIFNEDVKTRFIQRSKIIQEMRNFFDASGFLEVETPILQSLAGGALAKPFKTKLNALKMDLYLRIAPELYLKRLIVAGFEKIYEIGKSFRNEGMDKSHNPEFTMTELYWAYQDYEGLMNFIEDLIIYLLKNALPQTQNPLLINYGGKLINFKKPWLRKNFKEIIQEHSALDIDKVEERDVLKKMKERGLEITEETKKQNKWELLDEVYKKICLPKIMQPTFVLHHPLALSPLAKIREEKADEVQRFQAVTAGIEYVNGYSELNDPLDQASRFKEQEKRRRAGNLEASRFDKDFIEALEYGMPPTAGVGIGVDRLVMLLTNAPSLKEIIFFPLMRKK